MTPHSKCDKMTKELLVLGLYFVSFLRCYIVKQHWIGLLWHKINLQSNSQSRLDDYLKRLSPLSPPPPRWFPACCRPCRPTPSEGHAGEVRTRLGAACAGSMTGSGGAVRNNTEARPVFSIRQGNRADCCHYEPPPGRLSSVHTNLPGSSPPTVRQTTPPRVRSARRTCREEPTAVRPRRQQLPPAPRGTGDVWPTALIIISWQKGNMR